jgi:hypothetical protein
MIRFVVGLSAGLICVALTYGCSSSMTRPAPAQASPSPRPAAADASQTDVDSAMRKRGYTPELRKGEKVYCRKETLTGSNLQSKLCFTAEQIEEQERAGQDIFYRNRPAGCQQNGGCN